MPLGHEDKLLSPSEVNAPGLCLIIVTIVGQYALQCVPLLVKFSYVIQKKKNSLKIYLLPIN
jgi:hypothetical protein